MSARAGSSDGRNCRSLRRGVRSSAAAGIRRSQLARLGQTRVDRGGRRGDLGRHPWQQLRPSGLKLDRTPDQGQAQLEIAAVGGAEASPEQELMVVRGELAGSLERLCRLVVTALSGQLVGPAGQSVSVVELDQPAQLAERLRGRY